MTRIYAHQYTITPNITKNEGIRSIVINVVSEKETGEVLDAVLLASHLLDSGQLNIEHKVLMTGYRHD